MRNASQGADLLPVPAPGLDDKIEGLTVIVPSNTFEELQARADFIRAVQTVPARAVEVKS